MTVTAQAPARPADGSGRAAADPAEEILAVRPATADPVPPALRPWHDPEPLVGWFVTAVITILAAVSRLWSIGHPLGKQFDEIYYATEAQELLRYGYESNPGYGFIVHPSVGKWCIALSSAVFGNNEIGWRVAPALAGTACVFLTVRLGRRMFHSNLLGGIAGLLLTVEGVSLVLSRNALLDIFLAFFVLAGFAALVADRDQFRARLARLIAEGGELSGGVPSLGPRPWRLVGGIMLGLACGVKWSGLSWFVLFALMSLLWDHGALRAAGVRRHWAETLRRSVPGGVLSLAIAPVATYLFTWLGWWAGENSYHRHWADTAKVGGLEGLLPNWLQSLANYHHDAYKFHTGLTSYHPYKSTPWGWWVLGRPVLFTYAGTPDNVTEPASTCGAAKRVNEVLLIGTPLMWWAFVPILLWLLWHWATTRDWRAGAVWCAMLAGWFVWLKDTERTMFLFYMAPLIPFLVLGMTHALGALLGRARMPTLSTLHRRPNWRMLLVALYLGVVVADFAWMWPVFVNVSISYSNWRSHMWFPGWI